QQFQGEGWKKLGLGGGEIYGQSIFEAFGENPAMSQAVRRALSGEAFAQTILVDRHLLECHFLPQWNAEHDVVGVRGVALVIDRPAPAPKNIRSKSRSSAAVPGGEFLPLEGALAEWLRSLPDFVLAVA